MTMNKLNALFGSQAAELVLALGVVSFFDGTQYTRVQQSDDGFVATVGCLDERDWVVIV